MEKMLGNVPTVAVTVQELFEFAKHTYGAPYRQWLNLQRTHPHQFHRCVAVDLIEDTAADPKMRFEYTEDSRLVRSVTHSVRDIFELLPRLNTLLGAQVWVPDTLAERIYQTVLRDTQPGTDVSVLVSAFEASAMRRWHAERDREDG